MDELGSNITKKITLKDPVSLALIDADSTPTAVLTKPDLTITPLTVTHVSLGIYSVDYVSTAGGDHDLKWTILVSAKPRVFTDSFYVFNPVDFVVTLDDAKRHLGITTTDFDDEIRDFIMRAQSSIEARIGPLTPTTISKRIGTYNIPSQNLVLPITPVLSLTSVTPVIGTALDITGLSVTASGVVSWLSLFSAGQFVQAPYDVVWVAGRTSVEPRQYAGVLEMLRHLWATQRGGASRTARSQDSTANTIPGFAYTWPIRVEQLMALDEQSGIA